MPILVALAARATYATWGAMDGRYCTDPPAAKRFGGPAQLAVTL